MRTALAILALVWSAAPAAAQSEEQLRAFFEGKTVRVMLEMPGTSQGVDVHPGTSQPVNFPQHAGRLKSYGTAIRRGEEALVTKVRVKDDLIEFHLGGGGYGTFFDDDSPYVSVPSAPKTEREKNLERDLPKTTDPATRRAIREELDALRKDREREDARNEAEAASARQAKEANIRVRRLEGGSRFNLRYRPRVPFDALTPEGVMQALAEYLDFSTLSAGAAQAAAPRGELRKGLTVDEVDAILGRPEMITKRQEGTLSVSTSTYRTRDRLVTAEFVEGVLIRFVITSP
ncbi:MAG TPA: hypothetical protein VJK71_01265 [Gemmatimonadales bacterium]|nr:hypothetical protein [Gemmatimonadales bacterium]